MQCPLERHHHTPFRAYNFYLGRTRIPVEHGLRRRQSDLYNGHGILHHPQHFVMWCFMFFRRSSLRRESYKLHSLPDMLIIASVVRHALNIPNQNNNVLHAIVQYDEIAEAVNNEYLVPSRTAVIKLAKIISVSPFHIMFARNQSH